MSVFRQAGFVAVKDCMTIIDESDRIAALGTCRRFPYRTEVEGRFLSGFLAPIRSALLTILRDSLDLPELFPEFTVVTQMRVNDEHSLHADNVKLDGTPNHTSWRDYTAMLYLNNHGTNFTGGELRFPKLGIEIKPTTGMLVMFPCNLEHQHKVNVVTSGERYAISVWFTRDHRRAEPW